ncbi:MAG TPA: EAL domain-containing protein [Gammaproteobacteria bacterium]
MAGPNGASLNPGSEEARTATLRELPRKLAYMQTLWQKLLYVHWDAQAVELVRRLVHEIRMAAAEQGLTEAADHARKLEQQLQVLQSRNTPPPETERGRLQGLLQRLAHALVAAHAEEPPTRESRPAPASAAAVQRTAGDSARHIHILSDVCRIDDAWVTRLGHAGYAVRVCANLSELRQAMQQRRPDLLLAEVSLSQGQLVQGGLAGVDAIDALHSEFGTDIPVIFLATRGDLAARLAAVRAGGSGYFLRPLDEQELFRRIDELMPHRQPNYRVLIVEDEEQLASAYALVLQQAGFVAQVLPRPLQILEILQQFQPDLLLMDLHLAECTGAELMQLIRQDPAYYALPILFLSGDADPVRHNAVLSQGADLFLLKPIKPDQLIAAVATRIGRARSLRQRLQWLSQRDALTGLLNRHALNSRLERQLLESQAHAGHAATLLYIEPDRFRALRDRLGLAAVDLVLVDLAAWLKGRFADAQEPSHSTRLTRLSRLAHLGEGSFCVLLPGQDATLAHDLALQICDAVAAKVFRVGQESVSLTLSIGLATAQATFRNAQDWLGAAALACDVAHDAGGGRVELQRAAAADVADHAQYVRYARLLRNALEADGFYCVYQPIVNLHGQPVERYDVLLRARDEDGRELDVQRIFAVARSEGLSGALDRWVITHMLEVLQRRASADQATVFFIKLSAQTLNDSGTGTWIGRCLEDARVDARQLVFEFTEADVAAYVVGAGHLFARLRALGCGIALEHFGVSRGAVQLLGQLPVDYVKVDGALVGRPDERQRLRSLLEHTGATGVQVIAGFVEDAASLAALWQCGVQLIQGNFLQAPDAALDFDFRDEVVE